MTNLVGYLAGVRNLSAGLLPEICTSRVLSFTDGMILNEALQFHALFR